MLLQIFLIFITLLIVDYLWKRSNNEKLRNVPGPVLIPIIGSLVTNLNSNPNELLKLVDQIIIKYGRISKYWVFHFNAVFISDSKYIRALLSHATEIKKTRMYSLANQWLGNGLLLSHGTKWRNRRRVITPAFHFKILENFIPIMDQQATLFAEKLKRLSVARDKNMDNIRDMGSQCVINTEHFIGLATLDVICETAMRVKINAQTNEESEYVKNLIEMQNIFLQRFVSMAYRSNFLFKILNPRLYNRYHKVMKALHSFTDNIIRERRIEVQKNQKNSANIESIIEDDNEENIYGSKQRLALLDVLLSSTIDGLPLSDADIREEVDTFMFEGHDTTKSGIGFTLYALSREAEVQQQLFEEIRDVVGLDINQPLTNSILTDLKYMDKVIKESLRMYPPVPFFGRQLENDVYIDGQCLPAGVSVIMGILTMQNDPLYFEEPHRFLPDREMSDKAFVFVPFSAGPRNCIGQRFAMLEMKSFLVRTLQLYELLPLGEPIELTLSVVLKSKTGWQMGFRRRV